MADYAHHTAGIGFSANPYRTDQPSEKTMAAQQHQNERANVHRAAHIAARLDRLDVWSLSYLFIGIIGVGFLFTFYDIFDINVSWLQSCVQLHSGCTPANAGQPLKTVLLLNLAGYAIGTVILSPIADRIGRKRMLMATLVLTGLGSLYNALAPDYTNFVIARTLTGLGIGADLAIVNAYIGEVAPKNGRARYTSVVFAFSAVGAFLGGFIGLFLTTPAAPWPTGLPFAIAGPHLEGSGWRWAYGLGALLAAFGLLMRFELPESPRWLISRGHLDEAELVVRDMELRAGHKKLLPPVPPASSVLPAVSLDKAPLKELLGSGFYLRRVVLLLAMWLFAYATVYGFSSGYTVVLAGLTKNGKPVYSPPEAGLIAVIGVLGIIAAALFAAVFAERMDRRFWLPFGTVVTFFGCYITAIGGQHLYVAFLGSAIIFFGFDVWVGPTYALSAELFPTRARGTGFALVDGVGHLGGAFAILVIAPRLEHMSPLQAFLLIAAFQAVAAIILQFAPRTRNVPLEKVSP
ncbi:MFS transporter [Streptomyces lydicus]|uniref:MFS transporter n=1 Tax=Streptomyces lydicus TaxID=47763 RepID=UPI0036E5779D